jgi:ubiquinone/menaquinone biosynthesis C-methylase UbiE
MRTGQTETANGHRWFAAVYDVANRWSERRLFAPLRRALLGDIGGRVLEIGAGTGASLPHYGAAELVVASDPDPFMLRRAAAAARSVERDRAPSGRRPRIALVRCAAEALPFGAGRFDAVVSTLVLCSVGSVDGALAEAGRVLKPAGTLRFIEHVRGTGLPGAAHDAATPVWRRLCAGCHLNRRTAERVRAAGFAVRRLEERRLPAGVPLIAGVASRDSDGPDRRNESDGPGGA